eukprot:CAMPEP_0117005922 /NCGR_PEP_ID=MMETSP0472-20121206/6338_1 /TAXON_ID=693140 ORGANISM="Tiarina fusus, Strain LIS" /NCGR_SAMPLE_ID=MMETSP0472 /ASSEMBLY_ACC=CAM_ASM_000603 /LENGTH=1577 /DNA_ID=CAMNT_0004707247 /DNA_START=128 /DNA_END=4861 /DNA_ORIENTATION=-
MGSSHSAPRRPASRRPRHTSGPDSPTDPQGYHESSASPSRWPHEEDLPSLLEEEGLRQEQMGRRERNLSVEQGGGGASPQRRDRMRGLSVIGSSRSLRPDELDVDTTEHSFADASFGSPVGTRPQRRSPVAVQADNEVLYGEPKNSSQPAWGPPVLLTDGAPFGENGDGGVGYGAAYVPPVSDDHDGDGTGYGGATNVPPVSDYYQPRYIAHDNSSMGDDSDMESMTPSVPPAPDFFPQGSRHNEWMGRSLETLILGYGAVAPILCLPEDEDERGYDDPAAYGYTRRRSTVSTLGSDFGRRSSLGSVPGTRRGSLVGVGGGNMHGGTLANYYNRRRQNIEGGGTMNRRGSAASSGRRGSMTSMGRRGSASHGPTYRNRRMSMNRNSEEDERSPAAHGGPNIVMSLLAREITGRPGSKNPMPATARLKSLGGHTLFSALDRPAGGICSEVAFLSEVIDSGDWAETQTVISRISPRLIGDPSAVNQGPGSERGPAIDDPNLPPTASPFYAGGGRLGLERDAFVLTGGVDVLIRIFREPSFVGAEMARTYDARDLSEELVANRLAPCWNEALASLRELVYAMPSLVENEIIFDDGEFLPFLFTLLTHDSCFDGAAALIEEILSLQSHSPPQPAADGDDIAGSPPGYQATVRSSPPTTFFLGNVPDLYKIWGGFSCRQLAQFCRILALLVFEPEDRQLLESPAVLKSIELLQLRRNRAARAGRDSTVDMNQAILLGDEELTRRLLKLLRVMNFAPSLRRSSPYHVMAHFPFIADTLVMLGLNELDNWDEVDRLEHLARKLFVQRESEPGDALQLSELGSVADMLESLSSALIGNQTDVTTNQLGHIIHVISAAQQAGVVVGRPRQGRSRRRGQNQNSGDQEAAPREGAPAGNANGNPIDGLASAAGILTDQVLVRRFYSSSGSEYDENPSAPPVQVVGVAVDGDNGLRDSFTGHTSGPRRPLVNTPDDAANALQFNALLLGPYQVEVLFVLCTLLGGRRKIDAQEMLNECGVIPILDDMFQRLPWDSLTRTRQPISNREAEGQNSANDNREDQPNGIHGPGCECTPESALCVQYLRLLHNFCDRDCDNYAGRRLLLSRAERKFIFRKPQAEPYSLTNVRPGLLSKIIAAFMGESDESPYRFWLASCVESYLRGSSPAEQIFVARTGLLKHLIADITSERLHCAGSLQTSFDLLGELCKGNSEVLHLLVTDLDEESFRKLMSVAAANLVDSNVFIRSLLLSLERMSSANRLMPLHLDPELFVGRQGKWRSNTGVYSRSYLTHSWWDTCLVNSNLETNEGPSEGVETEAKTDAARPSDWFPTMGTIKAYDMRPPESFDVPSVGLHDGVGHFGWIFTPVGDSLSTAAHAPNTVERLSWFLAANQTRLLRDLLGVVDLRNINHENICCLNTAVVIAIFAYRRHQLHTLLQDLRRMSDEERETKRRAMDAVRNDDVVDRAFVQAMKYMEIDNETPPAPYSRRASLTRRGSLMSINGNNNEIGDRNDVMRNFREVLWFWIEYYTHRGRDRLSLEFSSHLRFQEWIEVVSLLGADEGAPTSLVRAPVRLPRSPYQRAARIAENPTRGA